MVYCSGTKYQTGPGKEVSAVLHLFYHRGEARVEPRRRLGCWRDAFLFACQRHSARPLHLPFDQVSPTTKTKHSRHILRLAPTLLGNHFFLIHPFPLPVCRRMEPSNPARVVLHIPRAAAGHNQSILHNSCSRTCVSISPCPPCRLVEALDQSSGPVKVLL